MYNTYAAASAKVPLYQISSEPSESEDGTGHQSQVLSKKRTPFNKVMDDFVEDYSSDDEVFAILDKQIGDLFL